jgi:urocanate hydratase
MYSDNLDKVIEYIKEYRLKKQTVSIGYLGNVVDLW